MPSEVITLELQYSADKFLAMTTEKVKEQFKLPYLSGFPGPNNDTYYVDRVEFGSAALDIEKSASYYILNDYLGKRSYDKVDGKQLRVLQKATVFLVKEQDLTQSGADAPPQTRISLPVTIAFCISLGLFPVEGAEFGMGQPYLYVDFDELLGIPSEIRQALQPFLPSITKGLGRAEALLGSMPSTPPFPSLFSNCGIMADESLSNVSILLATGVASGIAIDIALKFLWQPFFNGKMTEDLLQGKDFGLAIYKGVFEQFIVRTILDTVSDPDFLGKSDPSLKGKKAYLHGNTFNEVGWTSPLHYHIKFHLDLPKGCDPIDIGADTSVDLFFFNASLLGFTDPGVATITGNTLSVEAFQGTSISDWDKFACAAFFAFFAALGAPLLAGIVFSGPLTPLVAVAIPIVVFAVVLDKLSPSFKGGNLPVANVKKISDGHWLIEYSMQQLKQAGVTLQQIVGLNRHLLLRGIQSVSIKKPAELRVDVNPFQLGLRRVFTCDGPTNDKIADDIRKDPMSYLLAAADIRLTSKGDLPLVINDLEILNDGPHKNTVFSLSTEQTGPNEYVVTLDFDFNKARSGYFDDPYRCIVLLETTGGARIITFDPVQMPSGRELGELIKSAEDMTLAICGKFIVPINQGIHVEWLIDPDPTELVERLVIVSLSGLTAGSPVQLEGAGGEVIDQSVSDRNGRVNVSGLTGAASLILRGGLRASGPTSVSARGRGKATAIPTEVNIRQSGLRQLGRIELPGSLLDFQLGAFSGMRTLLCVLSGQLCLYDASDPQRPHLVQRRPVDSVSGAFMWGETIYAWGECGLTFWNPKSPTGPVVCHFPNDRPIRAVTASSGFFYFLVEDTLVAYNSSFTRLGEAPAVDAVTLASICGVLVIAYPDRVDVLTLESSRTPRVVASWPITGIQSFFSVTGFSRPCALIARDVAGTHYLLDVSATASDPGILATYNVSPWFAEHHRDNNLLVKAQRSATAIDLYVEARTESRSVAVKTVHRRHKKCG